MNYGSTGGTGRGRYDEGSLAGKYIQNHVVPTRGSRIRSATVWRKCGSTMGGVPRGEQVDGRVHAAGAAAGWASASHRRVSW
jgi:hypothetical protein